MTNEERDLITGLFNRLRSADNPQKDREAESLIQQSVSAQPASPYLLVQTLLVQEHALNNAQGRIQQLEKQLQDAQKSAPQGAHSEGGVGSFLSGLFGNHGAPSNQPAPARPVQPPPVPQQAQAQGYAPPAAGQPLPYPTTANLPPSAGGSFLKSALGTAAGVAGGAALFQGIQSLLGHNAGPFGGGGFGGGGSGFFGGGGYGGPEIIENREVINNYIDERGSRDDNPGGGSGNYLGEDTVGFRPHEGGQSPQPDGGSFLGQDTVGFQPHENNFQDNSNNFDTGGPVDTDNLFAGTPEGDVDTSSTDNTYDSGNTDAGSDNSGGGSDDGSYA